MFLEMQVITEKERGVMVRVFDIQAKDPVFYSDWGYIFFLFSLKSNMGESHFNFTINMLNR